MLFLFSSLRAFLTVVNHHRSPPINMGDSRIDSIITRFFTVPKGFKDVTVDVVNNITTVHQKALTKLISEYMVPESKKVTTKKFYVVPIDRLCSVSNNSVIYRGNEDKFVYDKKFEAKFLTTYGHCLGTDDELHFHLTNAAGETYCFELDLDGELYDYTNGDVRTKSVVFTTFTGKSPSDRVVGSYLFPLRQVSPVQGEAFSSEDNDSAEDDGATGTESSGEEECVAPVCKNTKKPRKKSLNEAVSDDGEERENEKEMEEEAGDECEEIKNRSGDTSSLSMSTPTKSTGDKEADDSFGSVISSINKLSASLSVLSSSGAAGQEHMNPLAFGEAKLAVNTLGRSINEYASSIPVIGSVKKKNFKRTLSMIKLIEGVTSVYYNPHHLDASNEKLLRQASMTLTRSISKVKGKKSPSKKKADIAHAVLSKSAVALLPSYMQGVAAASAATTAEDNLSEPQQQQQQQRGGLISSSSDPSDLDSFLKARAVTVPIPAKKKCIK